MDFKVLSIMILGALLLLNITGHNPPISGTLFELVGNNTANSDGKLINYSATDSRLSGVQGFSIWTTLITVLIGLSTIGVVVGFFTRTPPVEYLSAGLVAFLGGATLIDLLWAFQLFWSFKIVYLRMIAMLIFAPLILMLIHAMYEYWRNG